MIEGLIIIIIILGGVLSSNAQLKYLSDILTKSDIRNNGGYLAIKVNYWRFDTCLYSNQMCKYNTSTAFDVKMEHKNEQVICELLRGNNSGYKSRNPYDTLTYYMDFQKIQSSKLVRKLLIREKYLRIDTFNLVVVDTLMFSNYSLVKKTIGRIVGENKSLNVYVFKSSDEFGSIMLHYWVERIGIIKLTDEKCWRYSFEMRDNRTKSIEKMYEEILRFIKSKYKDPYWLSEPCGVSVREQK